MQSDEGKWEAVNRFSRNFHGLWASEGFWFLGLAACLPDGALGLPAAKLGRALLQLEEEALCGFVLSYLTSFVVVVVLFDSFLSDWFGFLVLEASQKFLIPDGVMCGLDLLYSRHKRSPSHPDPESLFLNTSLSPTHSHLYPLTPHLGGGGRSGR